MAGWDDAFADIQDPREKQTEYYPGSSRPIVRYKPTAGEDTDADAWDAKPRKYRVGGVEHEFFTVGQLAAALGRRAVTIRKWETDGILPKARFRAPSSDPRGVRRLYSREQVEGIVRIAAEEGVLRSHSRPIRQTAFAERVVDLFKSLGAPE